MGTRGPQSGAAIAVISGSGAVAVGRPKPPAELTDEQAQEWTAFVNSHAADKFGRDLYPLLAAYCRHAVAARHIAQLITNIEAESELDVAEYDRALKMQERETRCLASVAVRLGVAITTTHERKKTGTRRAPWEKDE
jgi:hypothetical protein